MTSFQALALLLSLFTLQTGRVRAQMATCGSEWGWMNNSKDLNPCQMVASLDGNCLNEYLIIPVLKNGTVYSEPVNKTSPEAICECNSPIYSLYSACAACQGAGWDTWKQWSAVCGVAHVGALPDGYFVTTPIPHWAFINVTVDGTFVPDTAMLVGGLPEQLADGPTTASLPSSSSTQPLTKPPSSSTSLSLLSSLSSSSILPSVTPTDTPKSKPPVGAIAGGTVGGIVALFLMGSVLLFFCKRMGLKIPQARKMSRLMSLLIHPGEWRPNSQAGDAAVYHPLLYDPTNPATFSQVNAELEKPLQPGAGNRGPIESPIYAPLR